MAVNARRVLSTLFTMKNLSASQEDDGQMIPDARESPKYFSMASFTEQDML